MKGKQAAILLASKDGAKYIGDLLDSIVSQDDAGVDVRVVLHDDGSADETLSIYKEYSKRYAGRFEVLSGPPQGGAKENFFYLMRNVEADYYFFADDDDVWRHDKLKRLLMRMDELEHEAGADTPLLTFSDMTVVDDKLRVLDASFLSYMGRNGEYTAYTEILIDNPAAGCSICMNRTLRDIAAGCVDTDDVEMHDVWVMMVAAVFGRIGFVDAPLVSYRQHADNVLGAATESALSKVRRNVVSLCDGTAAEEKKRFYDSKRSLARAICKLEGVPEDKRKVLTSFATMNEDRRMGRLKRIAFCINHKIRRSRHTLWMLLWI